MTTRELIALALALAIIGILWWQRGHPVEYLDIRQVDDERREEARWREIG